MNLNNSAGGQKSKSAGAARHEYDIVIIGSGIAGLYAAYTIQKHAPHLSLRVLEKHKKMWVGGRSGMETFYGTEVVTGAGIGRKKDRILRSLLQDLNLTQGGKLEEFKLNPYYAKTVQPIDIGQVMEHLKSEYRKYTGEPITFKQFAKPILGDEVYRRFLITAGYTDYENEDVESTLYHYGMDDNTCCLPAFRVHWRHLIEALVTSIGETNIHFSMNANAIAKDIRTSNYLVATDGGRTYYCKRVIVATTITSLRKLFPHRIYRAIEGQPFLRMYGKFSKQCIPIMKEHVKGYTCVAGPLQKIIPMDADNGVYMIAYSDNKSAVKLKPLNENTAENRTAYCRLLERALSIPAGSLYLIGIRAYYWNVGTHYYKPLNRKIYGHRDAFIAEAQTPEEGILVVGEVVSKHQGWTEGALESVENVVSNKWIQDISADNRTQK